MSGAEEFRTFIAEKGFDPPPSIEPGRFARFSTNGKRGDDAGYAKLFPDGEGGIVGDWRTGETWTWQKLRERPWTEQEKRTWRERIEREQRAAEAERDEVQDAARRRAADLWEHAQLAPADHPYLTAKCIKPHGLKIYRGPIAAGGMRCDGALVVPLRNSDGQLQTVEFIAGPGKDRKRYLTGGRVEGGYYAIGKPSDVAPLIYITEGFATGASVHEATGQAVAVAFNAGNLERVARSLHAKYPNLRLVIAGDHDANGTGQRAAQEAARAVGGLVALPSAPNTDWNDVGHEEGPEAVRRGLEAARSPDAAEEQHKPESSPGASTPAQVDADTPSATNLWPEPQPLVIEPEPKPYPIAALPNGIRGAVAEVVAFVKCPSSLAACSALASLSLAGQSLVNVRRAKTLQGPASLYFLSIADSGERKTACDQHFAEPIQKWETDEGEKSKPAVAEAAANRDAWEAKCEGIVAAIKQRSRDGKDTADDERALAKLKKEEPKRARVPKLKHQDSTPEALAWDLMHKWPSGGVLSNEAGIVFGAHGMQPDSIMRNLGLLNSLWDGSDYHVSRRSKESFDLRGARLTMGLAVQPEVVSPDVVYESWFS